MDIVCERCGESWDQHHILEIFEMYEPEDKLILPRHTEQTIEDMEGERWKFWFDHILSFFDGSFRIMRCPACEPRVGNEDCPICYGAGRVYVWKCNPNYRDWVFGSGSMIAPAPAPFRRLPGYRAIDGFVYRGVAHCPACFRDAELYHKALLETGWTEDESDWVSTYDGILHRMANEREGK